MLNIIDKEPWNAILMFDWKRGIIILTTLNMLNISWIEEGRMKENTVLVQAPW